MLPQTAAAVPTSASSARRVLGLFWLLMFIAWPGFRAHALRGNVGAHDPSTIVKDGNKYWVFTTGPGIPSKYSTDLLHWTAASRSVFTVATRPGWIAGKVPGFVNEYWAPECVFMNGKFYLYYSCSTFGSKVSGIGLATNVTLDPASPNYNWVDEGEVISSNASSSSNAIDPAVYRDASNNVWFIYGSFFGGIRLFQLDATTGKPLSGAPQYVVANGNVEAAYVKQRGSFYYLFINRGNCCQGANSTYYMQVGRSTSPSGPFLDKNGANLNNNGGSSLLSTAGRYIGPGHAGIFEENGVNYFSHHYYDGDDGGAPKLDISRLTWDADEWPVVSRNWVAPGRYTVANTGSSLRWEAQGCAAATNLRIVQNAGSGLACQLWDVTTLGDNVYQLVNVLTGQSAGTENCATTSGSALQMEPTSGSICQEFRLERAIDGSFIVSFFGRPVEAAAASTAAGAQLQLGSYSAGSASQRWLLAQASPLAVASSPKLTGVSMYPVPAERGAFTIELGAAKSAEATTVQVFNSLGQLVRRQVYEPQQTKLAVAAGLAPGIYQVRVQRGNAAVTQKQTVQ
ncbi:MAG TPA: family 43 glycosylhydrolase [Hymenobacter sp.]|uniref:family 43 glycosylhydrolase n=1 Tax=Hymenobacter sp. TaxID=1898978 RepID=UPI002ED7C605